MARPPKATKVVQNHTEMVMVVQAGSGKRRFVPLAKLKADEKA